MIRVLHTADWHVGRALGRISRLAEQRGALSEIVSLAVAHSVDAVLVAGDIFDSRTPSPAAEAVVYDTLLSLERSGIHVFLIAGNHDHPSRWAALAPLLSRFRVHVVADPYAVLSDPASAIIRLPVRDETLQVAPLPWIPLRPLVTGEVLMGEGSSRGTYASRLSGLVSTLCSHIDPSACSVFMGHMSIDGARAGGGERTLTMGTVYTVDASNLPRVQYAALGHIHRPQSIGTLGLPARYSGSTLQLDFGEVGYSPSVTIVDLEVGHPSRVEEMVLSTPRPLLDVKGTLGELALRAEECGNAFVRATLRCDGPEPGLADKVRDVLPNALQVHLEYPRLLPTGMEQSTRSLPPREQFARYIVSRTGSGAETADLDLFEALVLEAEGEGE